MADYESDFIKNQILLIKTPLKSFSDSN